MRRTFALVHKLPKTELPKRIENFGKRKFEYGAYSDHGEIRGTIIWLVKLKRTATDVEWFN